MSEQLWDLPGMWEWADLVGGETDRDYVTRADDADQCDDTYGED